MSTQDTDLQTLVVGLDAACLSILRPLFEEGVIPTLESIISDGASGSLESQIPPWTASAWPSLYTGTNPGKHGVFGFLSFEGYDWNVVDATHVNEHTLWDVADSHGRTSVVVNAPVTYPPAEIDGAIVPGYTAPEEPACHPSGFFEELKGAIGDYRVYPETEGQADASRAERLAAYRTLVRMRGEAFRYAADRFDPSFGFLQFQVTDTVCHELPGDQDALESVYGAVDEQLDAVLTACDPDTVVLVSDHGMGEYHTRFSVNEYLKDQGFVEATQGGDGMPTWSAIRDSRLRRGVEAETPDAGVMERALTAAAGAGLTSQRVGQVLDRVGLLEAAQKHVPADAVRAASEQVDFANSTAYVRSRVECGVRINLAGREPNGVVPEAAYDAVRDELIAQLSAVKTPDGEPVFEEVVPREDHFWGPHAHRAVDVVTVPNGFRHYLTTWLLGKQFEEPNGPTWDHRRNGLFAIAGKEVDHSRPVDGAHIFDVAPTVLSTLGLPRSDRMDGEVLPVVEPTGEKAYPEIKNTGRQNGVDSATRRRLSRLGYIE